MGRFVPTILVVALLGGSAAAFAVAERLKLERSPILATGVDKIVSPISGKPAKITFLLRKSDRVSVAIVDADGNVVRSLASARKLSRGTHTFRWYGRDDAGVPAEDAGYKPRVHLASAQRTILMPNTIGST